MKTEINDSQPIVLLIGTVDSEGVLSAIKATVRQYKIKRLDSLPKNWSLIIDCFDSFDIKCAVVKLTGYTYEHLVSPNYNRVRRELFDHIAKVPHALFIHENLFSGDDMPDPPEDSEDEYSDSIHYYIHKPKEEVRDCVNAFLSDSRINILPYASNAELTVMASSFIAQTEEGLLFRLYVPSKKMWANEMERLIQLFRDYLAKIGQVSVRLDQHRTENGIVFEFFSNEKLDNENLGSKSLAVQFQEFSNLLDLSLSQPSQAEEILRSKQVDPREILPILARYAKEARRIHTDLKHKREQRILSINHRLESELVDVLPTTFPWNEIAELVNSAVPRSSGISAAMSSSNIPLQLGVYDGSSVTVNVNPQIINAINSIVAQEINGDVHLTEQDQKILQLIHEHASERQGELVSAVHELADANAPGTDRHIAKQRLKSFLNQIGAKAGEMGVALLQSYIESKLGL